MATTNPGNFTKVIEKFLDQVQQEVGENLEKGLDQAQDLLIDQLKDASPKGESGDHYADHWKPAEKGKGYRKIKNDKTVEWKNGHDKHLAGILEYSTKHSKPHIESTRRKSRRKILKILKDSITNGA